MVVRSTPSGAATSINGTLVGQTPFKVNLFRNEVYRLDFEKPGFQPSAALLLPSSANYDQRYLRWGIDYDLGVATELIPDQLAVEMDPALGDVTDADRFTEMSAQITRADAMLASGEISAEDYKFLVGKIVSLYHTNR